MHRRILRIRITDTILGVIITGTQMLQILTGVILPALKPTITTILGVLLGECMVVTALIGVGTEVGAWECPSDGVAHSDGDGEALGDIVLGAMDTEVSMILSGVVDTTETLTATVMEAGTAVDTGVMVITTEVYTEEAVLMEPALTE